VISINHFHRSPVPPRHENLYVIDLQRFIIGGAAAGTVERVPPFSSCLVAASRHEGFIRRRFP
jgi:hypothetical protein